MAKIYRPRMRAVLVVPTLPSGAKGVSFPLRVQSSRHVQNDPNHADELSLTFDWTEAGADPRLISSAQVLFHLGNADEFDSWEPNDDNLRFAGIMTRPMRKASNDGRTVEAQFLDYTALFLRFKNFPAKGVPQMTDTLRDAWLRIIFGFAEQDKRNDMNFLAGALEFRGVTAPGPVIGSAAPARFRKKETKIQVNPHADAWAIWQQCVGMLGLISYFDRQKVVVTTTDSYYQPKDAPKVVWGRNILNIQEERNNDFELKGVGVTSYNPETGKVIESVYPAKDSKLVKSWDYFSIPAVGDQKVLNEVAKRAYEERSRQEFKGQITTAEMSVESVNGGEVDLLNLRAGDTLKVELDEFDANGQAILDTYPDKSFRAAYFETLGYDSGIAEVLAQNAEDLLRLRSEFHVMKVATNVDVNDGGGSFRVMIDYINRIQPTGDASGA